MDGLPLLWRSSGHPWHFDGAEVGPSTPSKQLEALVTPDVLEVIDWPIVFGVKSTKLDEALRETFQDPVFSQIVLAF
jgi:hypothetical protein